MGDWPELHSRPQHIVLGTWGPSSPVGDSMMAKRENLAAASWPAAKRAIYVPVIVETPMTIYQMAIVNGTVSGTLDVGIYSYPGAGTAATRLVSSGSTSQAGENTLQLFNITDTPLNPGIYFLAMVSSTTSCLVQRSTMPALALQACGVQQQALAEAVLPETATLANPASNYLPAILGTGVPTL